jgi:hypothetical protein
LTISYESFVLKVSDRDSVLLLKSISSFKGTLLLGGMYLSKSNTQKCKPIL